MRCPSEDGKIEILLDHAAGKLSAAAAREFESHLLGCEECRNLAAAQSSLWQALDDCQEIAVSPDFNRRLYARIDAEQNRGLAARWLGAIGARWYPVSWIRALPVAAVCATLLAAALLQMPVSRPTLPGSAARQVQTQTPTLQTPQAQTPNIDADQVERALDDIDMLKQIGTAANQQSAGSM